MDKVYGYVLFVLCREEGTGLDFATTNNVKLLAVVPSCFDDNGGGNMKDRGYYFEAGNRILTLQYDREHATWRIIDLTVIQYIRNACKEGSNGNILR